MATILNEAKQSRGVPPRGRSAAMQGFDLAIDDKTATDIYNRIDATEGLERDVLATQLENWASRKIADNENTAAQEHERIYTDLDGWWSDRGGDEVPEDVKFGAANRKFIADQFNQSAGEQGDLYPSYRDQYFLKTYGKAPASESEAYKTISESIAASQKVNQSYDLITGDIALALFDQIEKGTPVDVPALFTKWKEENAEILAALPDDWEANALKAAGGYYAQNEKMLREHGGTLQRLYGHIVAATGRKVEGAPEDDVKTVEDLNAVIDELGQLPKEVRDRGYTAILMAARRQGMEDKGFWEMAAEAWPRTLNTVRTTGLVAQETDAEAKVNLLRGDNPIFINKATGQVTPPSGTAFSPQDFEPVTDEQRGELLQQAETELQRFNVIRELRDLADNRFDPVKSNAKNGVLKFVQDIALMGPQSLGYTAMAAVPVAGPFITGAAIYADEYNQLRLEGMSSSQARTLAAVSAPLQTAAEVFGAKLLFGRYKWYRETIQKLINPARFARSSQAAVSFFGKVAGENITEGFQDLATPLVKDVASALSEEYPDVNWEETLGRWKDSRLEVMAATLMPVIGGSLVETFNNNERFASAKRRVQLLYKPMGITDEEVRYIEDGTTPEERTKRYTETLSGMSAERVQAVKDNIASQSRVATGTQEDATQPTLETQKDTNGRLTYIVRDETGKEVYRSTKQAAAEEAFILTSARSTAARFNEEKVQLRELVEWWNTADPKRADNEERVVRDTKQGTAQQKLEALQQANNKQGIEELHRRIAQSPYAGTPYDQIQILGEASVEQVGEMVFRSVIALNKNSRVRDAREEMHHTAVRMAVANGRASEQTMREWLDATERVFAEKGFGITLPRADMTDIVESMAVVQEAFENERISADVEMSLPQAFVDYIKRMIQVLAEVLKRGKAIREALDAGALPAEFEAFLVETTGVADQTAVDRARERTEQDMRGADGLTDEERAALQAELDAEMEQDAAEAVSDGGIDILDAVREAGGLPSTKSSKVYQYAGELKRIREAQKGGNAIGVKGTFNLFRKNAPDLDALIKDLQVMGFSQIETPSDLFDMIERRIATGRPIYGYEARAVAQTIENYSIGLPAGTEVRWQQMQPNDIERQDRLDAASTWSQNTNDDADNLLYGELTKDGQVVGRIMLGVNEGGIPAEVDKIWIDDSMRRQGAATKLLYAAMQEAGVSMAYAPNLTKEGDAWWSTIAREIPDPQSGDMVDRVVLPTRPTGASPKVGEFPEAAENYSIGLVSLHKLSEENLRFADRMGGLAVPSIAVTKVGTPIRGFGDITLVAGKELGDPSLNPVYDADAYTTRFPKPEYKKVKQSVAQKVVNFFRPFDARYSSHYGDRVTDVVWDNAVNTPNPDDTINKLTRSNVAKAAYLQSVKGVDVEPTMRPKPQRYGLMETKAMQDYIAQGGTFRLDVSDVAGLQKLAEVVMAATEESAADKSPEIQRIMRRAIEADIEQDGTFSFGRTMWLEEDFKNYNQTEVDPEATATSLDAALKGDKASFVAWVESTIQDMYAPPRIKVNGKWEPYTLENIVRVMSSGRVSGVEKTMAFGEGPARAAAARRFTSLNELRNAASAPWGIASEGNVDVAREKSREVVSAWREKVIGFYKWSDTWNALDNAMRALANFYKAGDMSERGMKRALRSMDFVGVTDEVAKEGVSAARVLMETPVPYFESKPQRVVRLNEFKAAIVPKSVSVEAVNILTDHGLEVVSVETSSDVTSPELQAALESVSQDISYSISTQSEIDRVQAAMGALDRSPLSRIKVYEKMQERFLRVMSDNRETLAAMEGGDLSQVRRTQILQALGELDGIISALPTEIRAKIGGYTQLAKVDPMDVFKGDQKVSEVRGMSGAIISAWMREGLNIGEAQKKTELPAGYRADRNLDPTRADRAIADVFIQRINRINEALEKFLRDEYNDAAVELFKRAKPQRSGAGEKPKGKLGVTVHELFDTLKEATEWSAEKAQAWADGQWARIEAGELNPYEQSHAMLAAQVLPLFADWANADSTQRAAAVTMGKDILDRAYKGEQQRIIAQRTKRGYDRTDLSKDAGVSAEDDKARQNAVKRENSLPSKWEAAMLNLLNFDQVLRYVFGNDSKIARQISDRQRKADNAKSDDVAALSDDWASLLTRLGGGEMQGQQLLFDLSRMDEEIDGVAYSQNQLVAITMMWMQPKGRQHMEGFMDSDGQPAGKWHYNQGFVNKAEALLTEESKAIREYLLRKYDEEYDALNKVYRKVYGLNLPKNQFYSPLVVESIAAPAQAGIDPVTGGVFAAGANSPSALRSRGGAIAQPVFRDAVQTYFGHMLQMAHWKAYAEFNSEVSALLGHRDTRNVVKGKAGEQAATVMNNWLQYFQQGGNKDAANHLAINQWINRMTGNFAAISLFGRVSTLALQVTQLGAASAKMPVGAYLSRFGKLMSGRLGWTTALDSDYIQRRIKDMPPAVALAMQGLRAEKPSQIRNAARWLGQHLSGFDGFFTAGTYAIVYDYQLSQARQNGMGGQEAADYAREATERIVDEIAQPTRAGARSIYELNSTNPVARAVWAFSSESRKNMGLLMFNGAKGGSRNFGKALTYVLLLNGLVGIVIRNAFRDMRDDDDDEVFDEKNWGWKRLAAQFISDPIYGIPVIGETIEGGIYTAFGVYKPSGSVFDVARGVPAATRMVTQYPAQVLEGEAEFRDIVADVNRVLAAAGLFNSNIAAAASISNLAKDVFEVTDNALGDE